MFVSSPWKAFGTNCISHFDTFDLPNRRINLKQWIVSRACIRPIHRINRRPYLANRHAIPQLYSYILNSSTNNSILCCGCISSECYEHSQNQAESDVRPKINNYIQSHSKAIHNNQALTTGNSNVRLTAPSLPNRNEKWQSEGVHRQNHAATNEVVVGNAGLYASIVACPYFLDDSSVIVSYAR